MIKPLSSRILIEPVEDDLVETDSGIVLGGERAPQSVKAKVLAVGPTCVLGLKAGDIVMVSQFSPTEARESIKDSTLVCSEEDVLGVVVPAGAAK